MPQWRRFRVRCMYPVTKRLQNDAMRGSNSRGSSSHSGSGSPGGGLKLGAAPEELEAALEARLGAAPEERVVVLGARLGTAPATAGPAVVRGAGGADGSESMSSQPSSHDS